ncbi:hypothetical protein FEM48_Zijuj09G0030100 [Ziziphus jujuba var. spinosa]|uniref:Classical arabinogalactan protein 26-like n=1 Tax=Ziziphus jujuba var. spinosa TaxID=714518 RepID=A0A978UQI5_ZIZJJ|nr:hypothetical protein FEM48_Zijuj09G0030100 [Ziziphus jujuba var. spinosa]
MLSSFMASFCSTFMAILLMVFIVCHSSILASSTPTSNYQELVDKKLISTISAAPALLPGAPLSSSSSPTLSPDITPLFPSPGGVPPSPTQSSLPTIPSSPSPPNPDYVAAPGPGDFAFPPSGSLPASSSVSVSSSQPLKLVAFLIFMVVFSMRLAGM